MNETHFHRKEKLKSEKIIAGLFKSGESFSQFPIRIVWIETICDVAVAFPPIQVAISVPKRNFKKATDRNRLKRQMREAYRLQKQVIYDAATQLKPNAKYAVMLIYTGKTALTYTEISTSIGQIIKRFVRYVISPTDSK